MSLLSDIGKLLLQDEKKAVLPDVVAFLTFTSTNGIALGGVTQFAKALVAVEADGVTGINQFVKDAAAAIVAYINKAQNPQQ